MSAPAPTEAISGTTPLPAYLSQHLNPRRGFSPILSDMQERLLAGGGLRPGPRGTRVESKLQHISDLRKRLEEEPLLEAPEQVAVHGVFYPAVLLTPGLWERSDSVGGPPIKWHTPLQDWLFSGFEEWAPSWDINASDSDEPVLLGQIGSDDEAYSLRVEIRGAGARELRRELRLDTDVVCNVEATCTLASRGDDAPLSARMETWPKTFHYSLFVDLEAGDTIKRVEPSDSYSGYLWECVSPAAWLGGKDVPELVDAFFIWEHTDLASPEAREYGLEALRQKHEYVERRWGELELIQKSAPIVPGTPRLPTQRFLALVSDEAG